MDVDKLDLDKLRTVHVDISKLRNVVDHVTVRKTEDQKLVAKISATDSSTFLLKIQYSTGKYGDDDDKKNPLY